MRHCLDCGRLADATRCGPCEQRRQRRRNLARPQYAGPWRIQSRAARAATPWCHCTRTGCHGNRVLCGTQLHLGLDHETGTVECRSCNSAHRRNPE